MHRSLLTAAALCLTAIPAAAQSIASRVAKAPDGVVQMRFAGRSGVCGDGRNVVAYGRALFVHPTMESYGRWSGVNCAPGPVRVVLTVRGGEVTALRTHVGGELASALATGREATDLGTVEPADAAAYLLDLAARAPGQLSRDAVLPAALAAEVSVTAPLLRIAGDRNRPTGTRQRALQWVGVDGDRSAAAELERIAASGGGAADAGRGAGRKEDDDSYYPRAVRESALFALSRLDGGAGTDAILRFARGGAGDHWLRPKAVFWLSQTDDPRARAALRDIAGDDGAPGDVRESAIFALSQGEDGADAADLAFLERLYGRLDDSRLQDKVIFSVSQIGGRDAMRWIVSVAADSTQPLQMRKQALFWAGQRGAELEDLDALYSRLTEPALREHYTFVLSQRSESAALDRLVRIARTDASPRVRKQALFWLGQKDDPRAVALIRELINK
ncbi:MAG TPA: hypothetical protein VKA84_05070 [Gemmatimonadaceae bacterium]|nr:hypothetical protein [Gemmatimonadaceae bacterium]